MPNRYSSFPVKNLAELAFLATKADGFQAFTALVYELQSQVEVPVAIIVDEHNEIYKMRMETDRFFRQFTISTGYLSGVRRLISIPPVFLTKRSGARLRSFPARHTPSSSSICSRRCAPGCAIFAR